MVVYSMHLMIDNDTTVDAGLQYTDYNTFSWSSTYQGLTRHAVQLPLPLLARQLIFFVIHNIRHPLINHSLDQPLRILR